MVSVCAAGTSPVYDLTVAGEHEFFANGVLVHNCTYALVGVPPPSLPPVKRKRPAGVGISAKMAQKEWLEG